MAKYMLQWEVDLSRTPEDPNERKQQWTLFIETVKQQLNDGQVAEWGQYVGESFGYCIVEGDELDVQRLTNFWSPFVDFSVSSILSADQAGVAIADM